MYGQIGPYIRLLLKLFYLCHLVPWKFIRLLLNTQILYKKIINKRMKNESIKA